VSRPHNVFRDGKVYVCDDLCETCVFRPGNLMHLQPGRLRGMVDQAKNGGSAIVCHSTLEEGVDNAICRGYWDRHKDDVAALTIAEKIGIVEEVPPPRKEHA
jgi:hypothetical protein